MPLLSSYSCVGSAERLDSRKNKKITNGGTEFQNGMNLSNNQ
jgi:hypothetical protein